MNLRILLPFKVYADIAEVRRLVVETRGGSYGILPNRLDCVMALAPGILVYETDGADDSYVALDEGVLIKAGREVLISARNAVAGRELDRLRETVEQEFLAVDKREAAVKTMLAKVEGDLMQRIARLRHGK